MAGPRRKLKDLPRKYWRLWIATTSNELGDGMMAATTPLLALALTRDPFEIGLVTASAYLPWLLFSLHAGVLVDRWNRMQIIRWTQSVQMLAVAIIAVLLATGALEIGLLVVLAFIIGTADVLAGNAFQAVLPQMVSKEQLQQANSAQYTAQTVARSFVGPPLGSALFSVAAIVPVVGNAVTYAVSILSLGRLQVPTSERASRGTFRQEIGAGIKYLVRDRLLRTLAVLLGANNFCNQFAAVTLVLVVTTSLGLPAHMFGIALTAIAAGSILGGIANNRIVQSVGEGATLIGSLTATGLSFLAIGFVDDFASLAALLIVVGFSSVQWNVLTVTIRQESVPSELFGRVNSVYRLISWGTIPLGAAAGGLTAALIGIRATYPIAGALRLLLLAITAHLLIAGLRSLRATLATADTAVDGSRDKP
ncbi:MFS transporter [Promicromonospora sukumoe]|uniref:MFS family permease n=1 Tax=Promicromonospora sukumoe TaxID=88382 RepID=A0A7W3PC83_9MICO|nr:MFS transporter [Promicromonospora sukumoe]MBA8806381.1 MFS family permease [Promicromonospora sukumoe]